MTEQKFALRIPNRVHKRIKALANANGTSMNQICVESLTLASPISYLDDALKEAVYTLLDCYPNLAGLAIFGSWAKGDMTDVSDIDVLVVLDQSTKLTRAVYSHWEEHAPNNTRVEPSFVVLPNDTAHVSGLWAEVAVSGVIIGDPTLQLQRYLNQVRQMIAAGKIVCKQTHGQNYWVHVGAA